MADNILTISDLSKDSLQQIRVKLKQQAAEGASAEELRLSIKHELLSALVRVFDEANASPAPNIKSPLDAAGVEAPLPGLFAPDEWHAISLCVGWTEAFLDGSDEARAQRLESAGKAAAAMRRVLGPYFHYRIVAAKIEGDSDQGQAQCHGSHTDRGVGVIVVQDGLVLASQRIEKDGGLGAWQFPGGHIENEFCTEAARRELGEETGLWLDVSRFKPIFHDQKAVGFKGQEYQACSFIVQLEENEKPEHREPTKNTPWIWVEPTHFARIYNVLPRTRQSLHEAFKLHTELFVPLSL